MLEHRTVLCPLPLRGCIGYESCEQRRVERSLGITRCHVQQCEEIKGARAVVVLVQGVMDVRLLPDVEQMIQVTGVESDTVARRRHMLNRVMHKQTWELHVEQRVSGIAAQAHFVVAQRCSRG